MSDWWHYFPKSKPRRQAKDGIRARTQRGEIGATWWSRRFVWALEALTDRNRLGRGRSYARSGQVMDLRVAAGVATSRVQGSRRTPYAVRIELDPFSPEAWQRAEAAMAERAVFLAALLAGDMPYGIEDAFSTAGLSIFPTQLRELRSTCSCPDWANPCKHVAATYYLLAEAFDEDPFLIFAWRGREKGELIERLRELRGGVGAEPGAGPESEPAGSGTPEAEDAEPLESRLADFWSAGVELESLAYSPRAAAVPEAVLRELGPPPKVTVAGSTLLELLVPAYRAMTVAAERRAVGGDEEAGDYEASG